MGGTLVDSNVLLDVFTEDEEWLDWSAAMLEQAAAAGPLMCMISYYASRGHSVRSAAIGSTRGARRAGT